MNRLETCIEALKNHNCDFYLRKEDAIAIVTRIIGAEPSEPEIKIALEAWADSPGETEEEDMKAALMSVLGGKEEAWSGNK